jgi:predicted site-specific integrase-resolvase
MKSKTYNIGVADAARRLGVSSWTLRHWCREGRVEHAKHHISGRYMFAATDLDGMTPHAVTVSAETSDQ